MKKVTKPNLTFILLGVVLAAVFFFAAIFTCIYSFRGSDSIGYYIGATVLQGITVVLSFLFMFLPDCLYSYWKQWRTSKAKPTIFYAFIATMLVGLIAILALIFGLVDKGWTVTKGSSTLINIISYLMLVGLVAAVIPSIVMLPVYFDHNK